MLSQHVIFTVYLNLYFHSLYPGRQRIRGICVIGVMLQQTSSNLELFMVNLFPRNHCDRIHPPRYR